MPDLEIWLSQFQQSLARRVQTLKQGKVMQAHIPSTGIFGQHSKSDFNLDLDSRQGPPKFFISHRNLGADKVYKRFRVGPLSEEKFQLRIGMLGSTGRIPSRTSLPLPTENKLCRIETGSVEPNL